MFHPLRWFSPSVTSCVLHGFFQLPLGSGPRAGALLIFFALTFLSSSITADQFSTKSLLIVSGERLELPGKTVRLCQKIVSAGYLESRHLQPAKQNSMSVNWQPLQKWKIAESLVPDNATIRLGERSLWQEHGGFVIGLTLFAVIATVLILILLRNLSRLRRTRRELNDRLRFERLIAMLSARFVNILPEKVDHEIQAGLNEVVDTMKLDHWVFFELSTDGSGLSVTHQMQRLGADTARLSLSKQQLPWLAEQISQGNSVVLPDLAENLPVEAHTEKEFFGGFGINSALAFPFIQAAGATRAILYASASRQRKWPDEIIHDLHSIGQIFASALARKEADESLRESEATINLAAQSANLGLWSRDMQTGRIWATERTRTLYNFSPDTEVTFGQFLESLHPDDRPVTEKAIAEAGADVRDYNIVHRVVRADGTERWIAARGRAIYSATGQPLKMMGASFDITERRQRALQTEGHRQELAHLSRVALMGEMASSLAHELNQPLTAIVTNAAAGQRFLDRGVIDARELHELLLDISLDGERAGKIIRGIREMVRKGNTAREPVDMNQVVKDVVRLTNSDAVRHGCVLVTELDSQLPLVEADAVQLQQVLLNLILNAFDAMQETPLHLRRVVLSTTSLGPTSQANGSVCTTVRDFGTGFSEKVRQQIFEHFFSTKREGLGMGLAIARSIVESFGGVLDAANAIDGGAIFHFTLPALH
ncbi:MAG: ATP-binding protein [Chthoniobacterales bacterium]